LRGLRGPWCQGRPCPPKKQASGCRTGMSRRPKCANCNLAAGRIPSVAGLEWRRIGASAGSGKHRWAGGSHLPRAACRSPRRQNRGGGCLACVSTNGASLGDQSGQGGGGAGRADHRHHGSGRHPASRREYGERARVTKGSAER
jgi:hypothetical protein